ncbi:MAG TPA: hypothetical protein VJU84_00265 [Pyrinomonadaceae bacterium]|nr:hypothetical protein [Pyrinomonadaceae bacterium]
MSTKNRDQYEDVFGELKKWGLLLESDPKLPSVCTIITGEPMKGSWWSHPMAQTIFQVNERLDDHEDVVIAKLLAGKVTFIHRQFWPALLAVGTSKEPWQMRNLSDTPQKVLKLLKKTGSVRSDELTIDTVARKELSESVRILERRLLIHSRQVHTESGAHAKVLESWESWAASAKLKAGEIPVAKAKKSLEQRVQELNERFNGKVTLPWQ